MPRVFTVKKSSAGKAIKCKKCQREIKPGENYFYYTRRFSRVGKGVRYTHCSEHRPRPTDLSSSPMAEIHEAQEDAGKLISSASCGSDLQAAIDDLKSVAGDVKQRAEDSLENMPENLRENSDSGQQLQERIDALESYISELESISIDESLELREEGDDEGEDAAEEIEDSNQEFEAAIQECEAAIDSLSV
jgi:predicted phage tail protein